MRAIALIRLVKAFVGASLTFLAMAVIAPGLAPSRKLRPPERAADHRPGFGPARWGDSDRFDPPAEAVRRPFVLEPVGPGAGVDVGPSAPRLGRNSGGRWASLCRLDRSTRPPGPSTLTSNGRSA